MKHLIFLTFIVMLSAFIGLTACSSEAEDIDVGNTVILENILVTPLYTSDSEEDSIYNQLFDENPIGSQFWDTGLRINLMDSMEFNKILTNKEIIYEPKSIANAAEDHVLIMRVKEWFDVLLKNESLQVRYFTKDLTTFPLDVNAYRGYPKLNKDEKAGDFNVCVYNGKKLVATMSILKKVGDNKFKCVRNLCLEAEIDLKGKIIVSD